jgi:Fe-S-cluster containining protein
MTEDDNGATYSFNVCGQCKNICCQDAKPPLSEKRKKIIAEHLQKQKINIKTLFANERYSYPTVDEKVYCLLFNKKTGKCMVHLVKPETCVSGPITFDINFRTKKVEWFLKKSEICAYAGLLFNDKAAFSKHFKEAKKQITSLINALSSEELRAIVAVEEPQTFKVGEDDLPPEAIKKLGL